MVSLVSSYVMEREPMGPSQDRPISSAVAPLWVFLFCFVLNIYLHISLHWVLVTAGGLLSCGMWDLSLRQAGSSFWCVGFSLVVAHRLQSTWAQ